jgi:hypothetical protein
LAQSDLSLPQSEMTPSKSSPIFNGPAPKKLLPLDRGRGFGGNVENDTVDAADLVADAVI